MALCCFALHILCQALLLINLKVRLSPLIIRVIWKLVGWSWRGYKVIVVYSWLCWELLNIGRTVWCFDALILWMTCRAHPDEWGFQTCFRISCHCMLWSGQGKSKMGVANQEFSTRLRHTPVMKNPVYTPVPASTLINEAQSSVSYHHGLV